MNKYYKFAKLLKEQGYQELSIKLMRSIELKKESSLYSKAQQQDPNTQQQSEWQKQRKEQIKRKQNQIKEQYKEQERLRQERVKQNQEKTRQEQARQEQARQNIIKQLQNNLNQLTNSNAAKFITLINTLGRVSPTLVDSPIYKKSLDTLSNLSSGVIDPAVAQKTIKLFLDQLEGLSATTLSPSEKQIWETTNFRQPGLRVPIGDNAGMSYDPTTKNISLDYNKKF